MAQYAQEHARLGEVRDLARAMAANQEMEIGELNHVRQDLGLPLYQPTGT